MPRNVVQSYTLPSNPIYVDIKHSDGRRETWPKDHEVRGDSSKYYVLMNLEDGPSRVWRHAAGQAIAKECLSITDEEEAGRYVLRDWPANYIFYNHYTTPGSGGRWDLYLFGGQQKFRSKNEFIPHAIWLMKGATTRCECKYCTKQPQRLVTQNLVDRGTISVSAKWQHTARSRPQRRGIATGKLSKHDMKVRGRLREKENRQYTEMQRRIDVKRSQHVLPDHKTNLERVWDVRTTHSRRNGSEKRWFREDEVVWVKLEQPIPCPTPPGEPQSTFIRYWPCVVEDYQLKTLSKPLQGADMESPDDYPWTIEQWWNYRIRFLALDNSTLLDVPGARLLPFLAHETPDNLLQIVDQYTFQHNRLSPKHLAYPNPSSPPPPFEEVAPAFALAHSVSCHLLTHYGVSHPWKFQYKPKPAGFISDANSYASLADTLTVAVNTNAAAQESLFTPPPFEPQSISAPPTFTLNLPSPNSIPPKVTPHLRDLSAPFASNDSSASVDRISSQLIGKPVSDVDGGLVTQVRFEGLWWGPERIWVDDLVRLITPRKAFQQSDMSAVISGSADDQELMEMSVFMRLGALFGVEVTGDDGLVRQECRASGVLYELIREETFGQSASTLTQSQTNGSQIASEPLSAPSSRPSMTQTASQTTLSTSSDPHALGDPPPYSPHYHLPVAPLGLRFRPILKDGYEAVICLSDIAGRYYPDILHASPSARSERDSELVKGLEGLNISLDELSPVKCVGTRRKMFTLAEEAGREEVLLMRNQGARAATERSLEDVLEDQEMADEFSKTSLKDEVDSMAVDV